MRYILRASGMIGQKEVLAIGAGEGPRDIVDLDAWVSAVKNSPRLRAVPRDGSRPTAIFTSPAGKEKEVYYQFGFIVPVEEAEGRDVMEDLARHLNELEERA